MAKLLTSVSYLVLLSQAPYTLASNLDDTKRFLSNTDSTTADGVKNAVNNAVKESSLLEGNSAARETVSGATDKNPESGKVKDAGVGENISGGTGDNSLKIPEGKTNSVIDAADPAKTAGFFDNFGKHLAGKNMVMTAAAATAIVGTGVTGIFFHKKNQEHQRLRRQQALAKLAEWESSFK